MGWLDEVTYEWQELYTTTLTLDNVPEKIRQKASISVSRRRSAFGNPSSANSSTYQARLRHTEATSLVCRCRDLSLMSQWQDDAPHPKSSRATLKPQAFV